MKAKDLAKILLMTPEAEVVHAEYTGCMTPLLTVNTVTHEGEGEKTRNSDGGDFINNKGVVTTDILILSHDSNI